jgi:hypothetical protein
MKIWESKNNLPASKNNLVFALLKIHFIKNKHVFIFLLLDKGVLNLNFVQIFISDTRFKKKKGVLKILFAFLKIPDSIIKIVFARMNTNFTVSMVVFALKMIVFVKNMLVSAVFIKYLASVLIVLKSV